MNYTICGNDYSYDVNTGIVTILTQITSTNLCFGVPKYLQPQTKILLNPISLAIDGIQTTTGNMPFVTASISQTFTVSDITKMPQLSEWHIYGNEQQGRFSVKKPDYDPITDPLYYLDVLTNDVTKKNFFRILDKKQYELKDHLGNVRVAIGDMKIPSGNSFVVDEKAVNDYYPYGMLISDRSWSSSSSRYGYNGKEMDNELKGTGNSLDFGARIFDSRTIRFGSMDPFVNKFSYQSPYLYAGNSPIAAIDKNGNYIYVMTNNKSVYVALSIMNSTEIGNSVLNFYRENPNYNLFIKTKNLNDYGDYGYGGVTLKYNIVNECVKDGKFDVQGSSYSSLYKDIVKNLYSNFDGLILDNSNHNTLIELNDTKDNAFHLFSSNKHFDADLNSLSINQARNIAYILFHEITLHAIWADIWGIKSSAKEDHSRGGEDKGSLLFGIIKFDTGTLGTFNEQLNFITNDDIKTKIEEVNNNECANECY